MDMHFIPTLGLLLVLVYSSSLMSYDQNALGSVSDNNDAMPADRPLDSSSLIMELLAQQRMFLIHISSMQEEMYRVCLF